MIDRSALALRERAAQSAASLEGQACRAVYAAIAAGEIDAEPRSCCVCGVAGRYPPDGPHRINAPAWSIVWHHHSYAPEHWLDVVPVCRSCHNRIHFGTIPEPRTGQLRTGDDVRRKPGRSRTAIEERARSLDLRRRCGLKAQP